MTKAWLGCATTVALATLAGCGGSSESATGDSGTDSTTDGAGGKDGTTHRDGMLFEDTGSEDTSMHHDDSGGPSDALLDISFTGDGFTEPDGEKTDGSMTEDSSVDAGCGPDSITCSGSTTLECLGGKVIKIPCMGTTPMCAAGYGCVACVPGSGSCSGSTGTVCNSEGTGYTTNDCDPLLGLTCLGGVCTGDCADIGESYIGCEYYSITMLNDQLDQSTFPYYVAVTNLGASSAKLTITGGALTTTDTVTVAAGAIEEIELPWVPALSCGSVACVGGSHGSGAPGTIIKTGGAYHIKSTEPITAYQFNAKDYEVGGDYSYTNDASLLLPVNAMTGNYRVASWGSWYFASGYEQLPGLIAIVGTAASTSVTVTAPTGSLLAGSGLTSSGGTVTLNAGDVLEIASAANGSATAYGSDPTGTLVAATAPVEVFAGSDCTYIPVGVPACDHIEEIQFPIETLGKDYLVTLPDNTDGTPQQYVKIVGTVAGTTLTYDPATGYVTAPATTLGAGQFTYFQTTQNFHVTASQPIAVAQYMESENNFTPSDTAGDPSMSMAVATAQFRNSYGFVAPSNYIQAWANIIAPTGASVTVTDYPTNQTITTGTTIGTSGYYVAHVQVCDNDLAGCTGNHTASSTSSFGIQVYGYGSYTSLMYPGGLNLNR
jgi:IgGFc binding protein